MAFPDLFKLEKLKIAAYENAQRQTGQETGEFEAMFNPQSFSQSFRTQYVPGAGLNSGAQSATFVRSLPTSLQIKLLLDGTDVEEMGLVTLFSTPKTVKQRIDDFLALAYHVQGQTHEPSFLKVVWAGCLDFACRLAGVTISYTTFDRDGAPLRAELDLSLVADDDLQRQLARAALSSPDVSHSRIVASGDTLPLMTKAVYGTSRHYLRVARVNGLSHFRQLKPGQELLFPPLASKSRPGR
ncbi:MAG: hypothetical protein MUE49_01290 [Rhodospirillales bacterium]|nr:hypothetical protein [Rhodospirillales bacterium]